MGRGGDASRPAACPWQMLEPGDAEGDWVRRNQHLAGYFSAAASVLSLTGMEKELPFSCGICEAHGMARENKGRGWLLEPSWLRNPPKLKKKNNHKEKNKSNFK